MTETSRYTSRTLAAARFVAQQGVMKRLVWSLTRVTVHHAERLEGTRPPLIVVANHSSHLDTPVIMGALPRRISRYLAAGAASDYFFENKLTALGTSLTFNAFPVDRKHTGKRRGMSGQLLEAGVPLLIFPEGTRSKTKAMRRFKPGVARLALSRRVPVLPIALVGAGAAMPRDSSWPVKGRPPIHVTFGTPTLPLPDETAAEFTTRLENMVSTMHDETAREVGMPTQAELEAAALEATTAESDDTKED